MVATYLNYRMKCSFGHKGSSPTYIDINNLTLRYICKESQNPSVIKTCSVGFNHYAELSSKKSKRTNHSGDILWKKIGRENFGAKT